MIEFRLLGSLDIRASDGRQLHRVLAQPKRLALLVYLSVAKPQGFHLRDSLLGLFWPELDEQHARGALRQALRFLRRELGDGVIVGRNDEAVGLAARLVRCDVAEFEQALEHGDRERAVSRYTGPLLEGFFLRGAPEYDRWLEEERERLNRAYCGALEALAEDAGKRGNHRQAVEWWRRLAVVDPYGTHTALEFMAALEAAGERTAALQYAQAYAARLREQLDAEPDAAVTALVDRLHNEPASLPRGSVESSTGPAPRARRRMLVRSLAYVGIGLAVVVGAFVARSWKAKSSVMDPRRVVVGIFANETADPSLDHFGRMAADWITQGLTYTGFVDAVSVGTPRLSRPVQPGIDPATTNDLAALGRAHASGTVVHGSYYLQGDSVLFQARITSAQDGAVLGTIDPVAGRVDAIVEVVEHLRDRVMAALAALTDPRLVKWMRHASKPPTFEAYRAFVEGIESITLRGNDEEALQHFGRSALLDSTFTMPLVWSLLAYGNARRYREADSLAQLLQGRRDQLAVLDQRLLDLLAADLRGDFAGKLRAARRVVDIAPRSEYLKLAGQAAKEVNRPREAVEFFEQADPHSGWLRGWITYWDDLTDAYHRLGDHRTELDRARRGRQQYPDERGTLWPEVRALSALGWTDDLNALFDEVTADDSTAERVGEGGLISLAAAELYAHGHRADAVQMAERAVRRLQSRPWYRADAFEPGPGASEFDPERYELATTLMYLLNRHDEARLLLESLGEDNPDILIKQADLAMWRGDSLQAFRLAAKLDSILEPGLHEDPQPYDLATPYYWRVLMAAALGERERAVALLREGIEVAGFGQWAAYMHRFGGARSLWNYRPFQELMRPRG